ncbi:hypothetical protein [Rhodoflexus sp.]
MSEDRSKLGSFIFEGGAQKVLGTAGLLLGTVQQLDSIYRTQPINPSGSGQMDAQMLAALAEQQRRAAEAAAAEAERQRREQRNRQLMLFGGVALAVVLIIIIVNKK